MSLYDFTFYDLILRNAVTFNRRPAWFEAKEQDSVSFMAYKEKVDHLACGLQLSGIKKGDRIGVVGKNSFEFFLLYGAAAALGAIVLPINWRLSKDEVAYNLNDCTPVMVFSDSDFGEVVGGIQSRLKSVGSFFNLKANQGEFDSFNNLLKNDGVFSKADVSSDDGFVIIHTAAVEGKPRGALLSHANLIYANLHLASQTGLSEKDVHLNLLPLFHVGGLFMAAGAFQAGALNVNMAKFDAEQAVELIEQKKVSVLFEFTPILSSILDQQKKTNADISSLQTVLGLDTPETIERFQKMTKGAFYCMYGQTETACFATTCRYDERPGSAGKSIPMGRVELVDDHDNPVAAGSVGEITLKGPMVFKGYWNLDKDNAHTFRNGRHHTGDLGRFDEDGYLWYAGRKAEKELIKPGGENVYPAEVEKAILKHPALENTMVFGVPDKKWKEGIKAVCVLKSGQSLTEKELIQFVGQQIASYKKPQYVAFVPDLPKTEDGSVDREKVKAAHGGEQL